MKILKLLLLISILLHVSYCEKRFVADGNLMCGSKAFQNAEVKLVSKPSNLIIIVN